MIIAPEKPCQEKLRNKESFFRVCYSQSMNIALPKKILKLISSNFSDPKGNTIPIKPKMKKRMYEHIVFLHGLVNSLNPIESPVQSSISEEAILENRFHHFVNSLATICDAKRGGSTVTAITVLDNPVTYIVASNRRNDEQLKSLHVFLERVLRTQEKSSFPAKVMGLVLDLATVYCKPRLLHHARVICGSTNKCLKQHRDPKIHSRRHKKSVVVA